MNQTYLTLNNGLNLSQFGLGVYLIPDGKETIDACLNAFKLGYRHIDTAHMGHSIQCAEYLCTVRLVKTGVIKWIRKS